MSEHGLYDATTIMNADVLGKCQREGWIKLSFYLLSFFYYLYGLVGISFTPNVLTNLTGTKINTSDSRMIYSLISA